MASGNHERRPRPLDLVCGIGIGVLIGVALWGPPPELRTLERRAHEVSPAASAPALVAGGAWRTPVVYPHHVLRSGGAGP